MHEFFYVNYAAKHQLHKFVLHKIFYRAIHCTE